MKKTAIAFALLVFSIALETQAGPNQLKDLMLQKVKEDSRIWTTCRPGRVDEYTNIVGAEAGKCHYKVYATVLGKKTLYQDCRVPISTLKAQYDKIIKDFEKDIINAQFDSRDNARYCKTYQLKASGGM